jgi:carbamoyl-phosphate synthase small subunit
MVISGINHPVKNLLTGKGEITSQNHGFAIKQKKAAEKPSPMLKLHMCTSTIILWQAWQ